MKKIFLLSIVLIAFFACNDNTLPEPEPKPDLPIANFSFTVNSQFPPSEVQFTNSSAFSTNYNWDFGDGSTSTESDPDHTYLTSGDYTIILTASDDGGHTNIKAESITISSLPTTLFIKSLTVSTLPFVNQVNQTWDLVDGPDVYVSFQQLNYVEIYQSDVINNIEETDLPVIWTWDEPYQQIANVGNNFYIVFIEYDGFNLIAGMETPTLFDFDLYGTYPETIQLTSPNGKFIFEMELEWK